jgi:hypothetical protein
MAAARQKEMNDNMTVVATTTLTAAGRFSNVTETLRDHHVATFKCACEVS